MSRRTLVIAEPGGTHDGRLDLMLRLVDAAAECGAGVIKPQWTSSAERMCERRNAPDYLEDYRKLQFPLEWHGELATYAKSRGLQYACTVFLPGDAAKVAPFVDYLKISSFEAGDFGLIMEATTACPNVIVSLGMAATNGLKGVPGVRWLHCVSSYPAPLDSLNLSPNLLWWDGLSDHTRDVRVGAWAVCVGAKIIETHFRLNECDPANKDYAVAFTPVEFKEYVRNIRDAERALSNGQYGAVQECEREMLRFRARV